MSYVLTGVRGSITVTPSALSELVVRVDGHARVRIELAARYGVVLPRLARMVQERVSAVEVDAVDVSVEAVK